MKKKISILLLAVAAGIGTMFASTKIGDLYYNLDASKKTAEVAGSFRARGAVVIPSSVTYNEITYSVTTIGENALAYCSGMTSVTIPNSVTSIANYAFEGCISLTSVTIPNSVTSIGNYAFRGCTGLTSVTIPNSVTSIGDYSFYNCSGMTSVTIPNSVTSIGENAFCYCSSLTSIDIPNSVTSIGNNAFAHCSSLTSVTIPNSVTSIGDNAFFYCDGLTSVTIPNSVTSIGNSAFAWCGGLTSVTIPNSVTSIGNNAFAHCSSLTSVTIPNSVTSIGDNAFYDCSGLTSIEIPNSVTSIGSGAFYNCTGLAFVTIEAETPPALGSYAFYETKDCPIYVPCGTLTAFQSSWSNYAYRITYPPFQQYTISAYAEYGEVSIVDSSRTICGQIIICTTIPIYGYHFTRWSDGNTDNPRTITLTSDTTFTAECAKNSYTISTTSANQEWGTTAGDKSALYLENVVISATANYGYHFVKWNDNNTENPRTISVTKDATYTATFAKNTYSITKIANSTQGSISGPSKAEYLDNVTLTVNPNYGYHFTQWSDGNTNNPRTFVLTQDTTFTAEFARNPTITYVYDSQMGNVTGPATTATGIAAENITFNATSNYGYHFLQWNDGNTDNPRTIWLSQDTTFTAEFAKNSYTISTTSANPEWGTTAGDTAALYLDEIEISAIPNYGYHFVRWNDNNRSNPRTVSVTEDKTYTATFAKNVYTITLNNAEHGSISGGTSAEYLDEVTLTANPDYGYHFTQWSDGNKENPRTFVLTQDTTFTAEFAIDRTGTCGDDNELTWTYDPETKTLTITGNGALNSNYTFGVEAPTQMQKLVIGNEITSIGDNAFYGMSSINHLIIGGSVATIGNYAFAECRNFDDITCYATTVPIINETTFANVGNKQYIYLFVPAERERAYYRDTYWGEFDIQVQQAEETTVTTNDVTVEPQDNAATVTWPTNDNAASYTIVITKDSVLFCTLTFNANGQLTGIAFAPSREGSHHAPAAIMTANGLQFTVTGLDSGTQYGYNLTAKDANDQPVATYSGEFTTTSEGVAMGVESIQPSEVSLQKILRNGQILILCGEKVYTLTGQEVK